MILFDIHEITQKQNFFNYAYQDCCSIRFIDIIEEVTNERRKVFREMMD